MGDEQVRRIGFSLKAFEQVDDLALGGDVSAEFGSSRTSSSGVVARAVRSRSAAAGHRRTHRDTDQMMRLQQQAHQLGAPAVERFALKPHVQSKGSATISRTVIAGFNEPTGS